MKGQIILAAVLSFVAYSQAYPIHASCKIQWTFGLTCDEVKTKLKNQITAWATADNCPNGAGEKCLYHYVSDDATTLVAKHETPVKHYVDDLTFTFTPSASTCSVKGYSTSETWYAHLDYSTNYCNLHNLVTGAGLDQVAGYREVTSDAVCTQYSSRNCEKY